MTDPKMELWKTHSENWRFSAGQTNEWARFAVKSLLLVSAGAAVAVLSFLSNAPDEVVRAANLSEFAVQLLGELAISVLISLAATGLGFWTMQSGEMMHAYEIEVTKLLQTDECGRTESCL